MSEPSNGELVEWSGSITGRWSRLSTVLVVLVTAPRPLWVWFVLVQPAFALALAVVALAFAAVPWPETVGLIGFATLAVLPAIGAWGVASRGGAWLVWPREEGTTYVLDPDRSTLYGYPHRDGPATLDDPDDVRIDLRDLERLVTVPVPTGAFVVLRPSYQGFHRREERTAPRFIVVPRSRLPDLERALDRVRGVELEDARSSPGVMIRIVLSALVPAAGLAVGVGLIVGWLIEAGG